MPIIVEEWRQQFSQPAYPRKVMTLNTLEQARNIIEAWGDDSVTLTGDVLERHKLLGIANTQHGETKVHVGLFMALLMSEIDALHDTLEEARITARRERIIRG